MDKVRAGLISVIKQGSIEQIRVRKVMNEALEPGIVQMQLNPNTNKLLETESERVLQMEADARRKSYFKTAIRNYFAADLEDKFDEIIRHQKTMLWKLEKLLKFLTAKNNHHNAEINKVVNDDS